MPREMAQENSEVDDTAADMVSTDTSDSVVRRKILQQLHQLIFRVLQGKALTFLHIRTE